MGIRPSHISPAGVEATQAATKDSNLYTQPLVRASIKRPAKIHEFSVISEDRPRRLAPHLCRTPCV